MWFHANGRNIVALRFAGYRTIEMLGLVGPKVGPVSNYTQQVPTLLWFHANGRNIVALRFAGQRTIEMSVVVTQKVSKSAVVVVDPCKRTQHVGPNNVACCLPTMSRPFAWNFKHL